MKTPRKQSVYLPEPLDRAVQEILRRGPQRSVSQVVRAALFDYLRKRGVLRGRLALDDFQDGRGRYDRAAAAERRRNKQQEGVQDE